MCTAVINESKNIWINRNVMTTLGLVLPGGKPDVRTSFADLTKEMLFEWGKQRYFRRTLWDNEKHSEDFRLKLNWTLLYATSFLIGLSVVLSFDWMKTSNARSSYFSGLLSGEFVLSVALVMNMLLYTFSPQEFHNGLTLMDSSNIWTQVNFNRRPH